MKFKTINCTRENITVHYEEGWVQFERLDYPKVHLDAYSLHSCKWSEISKILYDAEERYLCFLEN